jgi:hypothetical protein
LKDGGFSDFTFHVVFLEVNFMDSFIMPIESVQEAEVILKEIWN